MIELLTGIVSGILATVVCFVVGIFFKYIKEYRNSEYSGEWVDEIYNINNLQEVIKRDRFQIKHNKKDNTIKGSIKRYYPEDQKHREWDFNGVIDGRFLILSFWGKNMQNSNGCVYVKLNNDYEYDGYYLEEHGSVIDTTPIKLRKVIEGKK